MKLTLQITSWVSVVIGVLAFIGGLGELAATPTAAYYSFMGGAMFAGQAIVALAYINYKENQE